MICYKIIQTIKNIFAILNYCTQDKFKDENQLIAFHLFVDIGIKNTIFLKKALDSYKHIIIFVTKINS